MDPINPWLDATEVRQLAEKLIRPVEKTQVSSADPGFDTSFVGFLEEDAKEQAEPTAAAAETIIPKLQPVQEAMPVPVKNPFTPDPAPFTPKPALFTPMPAPFTAVDPDPEIPVASVPFTPVAAEPEIPFTPEPEIPVAAQPENPVAEAVIPVTAEPEIPVATEPEVQVATEPVIPTAPQSEVLLAFQPAAPFSPAPILSLEPARDTSVSDSRFTNFRNWLTDYLNAREIFIIDQTGEVIFDESRHGRLHFIARDLILHVPQPQNVRIKFGPIANLELVPCDSPIGLVVVGALFPVPLNADQIHTIRKALR